jgi:hypothetical protein
MHVQGPRADGKEPFCALTQLVQARAWWGLEELKEHVTYGIISSASGVCEDEVLTATKVLGMAHVREALPRLADQVPKGWRLAGDWRHKRYSARPYSRFEVGEQAGSPSNGPDTPAEMIKIPDVVQKKALA